MECEKPAGRRHELSEWFPCLKVRKLRYEACELLARFRHDMIRQVSTVSSLQKPMRASQHSIEAPHESTCTAPINSRCHLAVQRQALAGARDVVKGIRNDLAARVPLDALVRRRFTSNRPISYNSLASLEAALSSLARPIHESLYYRNPPHGQFVDIQASDTTSTDIKPFDHESTDGESANRKCAERHGTNCQRTDRQSARRLSPDLASPH